MRLVRFECLTSQARINSYSRHTMSTMSVYRAEVVGSLLRPSWLKQARAAWLDGRLSAPEFKRIEDRAVDAAIAQQEGVGLDVVTDGELRRSSFLGPLIDTVDGLGSTSETIEAQRHWRRPSAETGPLES